MPKTKVKVGFPGKTKDLEITLPEGELPPWGADETLRYVGTDVRRIDAADKLTGRAKYTYDVRVPGMLTAKILHAPFGAGTIQSLDTSKAARLPGVRGIHVFKDVGRPIHYHGDEILAIAAETEEQAEDAIAAVEIAYDRLPAITSIDQALRPGARQVFAGKDNVQTKQVGENPEQRLKDAEAALAKAKRIVVAHYETQVQTHSALETKGVVAMFEKDGSLKVWSSTQGTFGVKGAIVEQTGLTDDKVTVIADFVGGGFGAKFRLDVPGLAAVALAQKTKRPVKCMLTRQAEHTAGGNRPNSRQHMRGGVDAQGKIVGLVVETWGSAGAGNGAGCANPAIYDFGKTAKTEHQVYTNWCPGRAFRAPGHPQGIFAVESFMDELAHAAGLDPLEFRRRNTDHPFYDDQWTLAAKEIGWHEKRNRVPGQGNGTIKRGIGMGSTLWSQMGRPGSSVDVTIRKTGEVIVENGAQDIGTGTKTLLAVIAAEELGLPPETLTVRMGDTRLPEGPGSGGSATAPGVGPAVRTAAAMTKAALLKVVATKHGVDPETLGLRDGQVTGLATPLSFEQAAALITGDRLKVRGARGKNFEAFHRAAGGCQFAEVEVDTETGIIRVLKVVAVQDAGRVISKLLFESQVLGGVIQGLSYALCEQQVLDRRFGTQLNADLLNYKIVGSLDMPEIVPIAFSVANAGNNCGMMGLGEPPKIPTPAAIANAVFNATGARVRSLPMTPDKVLAALQEAQRTRKHHKGGS